MSRSRSIDLVRQARLGFALSAVAGHQWACRFQNAVKRATSSFFKPHECAVEPIDLLAHTAHHIAPGAAVGDQQKGADSQQRYAGWNGKPYGRQSCQQTQKGEANDRPMPEIRDHSLSLPPDGCSHDFLAKAVKPAEKQKRIKRYKPEKALCFLPIGWMCDSRKTERGLCRG